MYERYSVLAIARYCTVENHQCSHLPLWKILSQVILTASPDTQEAPTPDVATQPQGTTSLSLLFSSVQFSLNPMNRSMPGLPVHHQLPEFTQTHAHQVGDAIQPSHPLSSPSPPAPNPSQHQGLFQ